MFQVCSAGSRLLVQESVFSIMVRKLKDRMERLRVGDSMDKTMDIGAVVDESQRKSVQEFVDEAKAEGAEVIYI